MNSANQVFRFFGLPAAMAAFLIAAQMSGGFVVRPVGHLATTSATFR